MAKILTVPQPFDLQPVWLSLRVASASLVLVAVVGVLAAGLLARRRFFGKTFLEAFFLLPLVLPPVVTGYVLLVLIGRRGVLGAWLERAFDLQLLFTPQAAVLAASAVAFPLMYGSAKVAFESVDQHLLDAARSLGATTLRVFATIAIPLALPGLVAGGVLAFARALGEFGATIMVAGNIAGQTTTMPTAIYSAAENGDLKTAGIYAAVLGIVNMAFMLAVSSRRFGRTK